MLSCSVLLKGVLLVSCVFWIIFYLDKDPNSFFPFWTFTEVFQSMRGKAVTSVLLCLIRSYHHHHHQFLNREGRWGTTDDFATSFLHFSLFSAALWDLPNSRPVHSLMLSSHLFLCPPCLLPLSLCLARWFWPDLMNGRHDHTTAVCVSLRSSEDLHVVRLPARSWHGLPRW